MSELGENFNQVVQGLTQWVIWEKFQSGSAGVNSVGDLGENYNQVVQWLTQWVIWEKISISKCRG